jgi:putative acetyltransferase
MVYYGGRLAGGLYCKASPVPVVILSNAMIRLARHDDSPAIIDLIADCYAEYDDRVCLEAGGAETDLLDLESRYRGQGGEFWVLELEGRIRGSHAALPHPGLPGVCCFRRLYLDRSLRGRTDWGHHLMQVTIDWARDRGFRRVEFWSDTRFQRAHRFFRKFGFEPDGRVREMHDGHEVYSEYFFFLDLSKTSSARQANVRRQDTGSCAP